MTTGDTALQDRWWHASGGILWHCRALRYRARWRPFREAIAGLLQAWSPQEPGLLLIGPSAGWTLPASFLERFTTVTAVEPDPLARWLFALRFPGTKVTWLRCDAFAPGGLDDLQRQCPGHAVLFCNVAGQVLPDLAAEASATCARIRQTLAGGSWASFHDLASLRGIAPATGLQAHAPGAGLEAILGSHGIRGRVEVVDHLTECLARDLPSDTLPWPFRPGYWHLVQWVAVRADAPPR